MAQRKKIIWAPSALNERHYILDFWINHNNSLFFSIKLDAEIDDAIDFLADHPYSGHVLTDNLRKFTVREYQIFYEVSNNSILILSTWDGRQDPEKLTKRLE